jgi:hypothetical protein
MARGGVTMSWHQTGAAHSATHYLSCPPQAWASPSGEAGTVGLPEEIRLVPHDPLVAGGIAQQSHCQSRLLCGQCICSRSPC